VRERFDAPERVRHGDVRRYDLLHGQDLVQLLRLHRFLEDALQQRTGRREHGRDDSPPDAAKVSDGEYGDRDTNCLDAEADDLVAEQQRPFVLQQLGPENECEVEQRPTKEEMKEDEQGERRQALSRRHAVRPTRDAHRGIESVRRDQRQHLPAGVDPGCLQRLSQH
jgi:hypothetical protein